MMKSLTTITREKVETEVEEMEGEAKGEEEKEEEVIIYDLHLKFLILPFFIFYFEYVCHRDNYFLRKLLLMYLQILFLICLLLIFYYFCLFEN